MFHRRYSQRELEQAALLHVRPRTTFEPAGEESLEGLDDVVEAAAAEQLTCLEPGPVIADGSSDVPKLALTSVGHLDGRRLAERRRFSADEVMGEAVEITRQVSKAVKSVFRRAKEVMRQEHGIENLAALPKQFKPVCDHPRSAASTGNQ